MRKLLIGLTLLGSAAAPAPAQPAPPKLLIAISVDQLSSDLWDSYRPHFRGGFARLAGGADFRNGYQSHAATETCPGHSTILTARLPASNGIVANQWVDQAIARSDKVVYCAEDETVEGSTSTSYTVSPAHLKARTLGDLMKAANPASRNVAVAGKDRAAVMMGGRAVDQRWYWNGKAFATDLKGVTPPRTLPAVNAAVAAALAAARPALDPPPLCAAKARSYALAPNLSVGANRFARAAGDARALRISPEFDALTLALSAALIQEMGLGRGPATDLISIGLSATDYVGHAYGTDGMEMCLQLLALDRELESFFAMLDRAGIDFAVVLTSDHGGMDIPERLREKGVTGAARAVRELAPAEVGKRLAPRFDQTESVLRGLGIGGDVWVDAAVPASRKAAVVRAAKDSYAAHPQVHAVFTREEILRVALPSGAPNQWSILQRVRAAFDPTRSGDLYVVLKEHVSPIAAPSQGYVATHGSPWDYDRRVPILFWRKGQAAVRSEAHVDTIDIMPTLAAMIGLRLEPAGGSGRCLSVPGIMCPR